MARATYGETLQQLFREHELGHIPTAAFEIRKRALLRQCRCELRAFVSDWRRDVALTTVSATITSLAMLLLFG